MDMSVYAILQKVYGARGIPFPKGPKQGDGTAIAPVGEVSVPPIASTASTGGVIRKYDDDLLGRYQFLPATIIMDGQTYDLPNALVIITGEKEFVQTDIVDVGTVFEQVFIKPYDITIICTLIGENGNWPESKIKDLAKLYKHDGVVTLQCALTDIFIKEKDNFLIQRIDQMTEQGSENVEVFQITGLSNIEFVLEVTE